VPSVVPKGFSVLVAEDDYFIAEDLANRLSALGVDVVGPAYSVTQAQALAEMTAQIDGAILDVNLRDEPIFPVADVLAAKGVPIVLLTGYDRQHIDARYRHLPHFQKPCNAANLVSALGLSR
jgi:CheY-like chemotaxis protein